MRPTATAGCSNWSRRIRPNSTNCSTGTPTPQWRNPSHTDISEVTVPFIPHTQADIAAMLEAIGASSIEELFDEIPPELRKGGLGRIPPGVTELEITQLM